MSDRFSRLAPLVTGVLFVALALGGTLMVGNTPATTASGTEVLSYYTAHHKRMGGGGFLIMLSVVAGLFFYAIVRSYLSRSPRAEWLAVAGFGGAVIFGVSALVQGGIDFAFSDVGVHLDAGTAQVLNILQSDISGFTIAAGIGGLMLAFGTAMLRGRLMPRWMGWATVVIGVLAVTGPLIGIAIPLEAVWVLVMSFMLFKAGALLPEALASTTR
ncbi:MAG: hypothetical protein ACHQNA_06580 [Acidimicrobiales bacterium]